MGWTMRTAAIKGRKEEINAFLNESKFFDVTDIEELGNDLVLYRVFLGDEYFDCELPDIPWAKHEHLKFLILANRDGDHGDKALFKQFGSNKFQKGAAFNSNWFSTYREEFESCDLPFMDEYFVIELESYSDGETYKIRNSMKFEREWEDDSLFLSNEI